MLQKIKPRWSDFCIVAASGPSLTPEIAEKCRGFPVVAVNDAYRLLPFADVLYACDARWWDLHRGCSDFSGEKWSSHGNPQHNNKIACAEKWSLKLIRGRDNEGFSTDPAAINYGGNSGFQGVNLAGHFLGWRGRIALVGFDMRVVDGKRHFFGEHPPQLSQTTRGYSIWPRQFERAAARMPPGMQIVNCTQGSALTCFPIRDLADVLPAKMAA